MPVIKSAIKKMRQDVKRRVSNRLKSAQLKNLIKKAKKTPTEENVKAAISFADKVAKKHLIHKSKAAHIKSQLSKLLSKGGKKTEEHPVKKPKSASNKKALLPPTKKRLATKRT